MTEEWFWIIKLKKNLDWYNTIYGALGYRGVGIFK